MAWTRLPNNIFHHIAIHRIITARDTSNSWFIRIRDLCLRYGLPTPISQLRNPLCKQSAKPLFKSKVIDYHETTLRESTSTLSSLSYFNPHFMSLTKTHPIWTSCSNNSYKVSKSVIEAKLLSGRYRSDRLTRHFQRNTSNGDCRICNEKVPSTIEHLLLQCHSLAATRCNMFNWVTERQDLSARTKAIISEIFSSTSVTDKIQLLLDCSCLPETWLQKSSFLNSSFLTNPISSRQDGDQTQSEIFKFARTWCFSVHVQREKILNYE